jgi:hypothetical protein
METADTISDGTHKGSDGLADQRIHGEHPQMQRVRAVQMTWTKMETADSTLSDRTHKGSDGQADDRTRGEDPQSQMIRQCR